MIRLLLALLLFATPASAAVDSIARGLAIEALNAATGAAAVTSLAITNGTQTTNIKALSITQTWNNAATVFDAPFYMNITGTAYNAASALLDIRLGGVIQFGVYPGGVVGITGTTYFASNEGALGAAAGMVIANTLGYGWSSSLNATGFPDTLFTRFAAASIHLGNAAAAAPVAQTLGVQSVVAGTTDTAGSNWTLTGSQGTGLGVGGDIIFKVAKAGSTGTAQNALTEAFRFAAATALPMWPSSTTGAGTSTFTNSPCSGLTTEQWVPIQITGQTGTWYVPACQ